MQGMTHMGSKYTDEDRKAAVACYAIYGNFTKCSQITGIPIKTIHTWKHQADWWEPEITRVRSEKSEELDALYTNAIHKAQEAILDRLESGDYVLDKQGELQRKPISGKDLAMIGAIQFDKRQIMRNLPTSISANSKQLEELAEQFKRLANTRVIEGEVSK